jgi:hypothetical protein
MILGVIFGVLFNPHGPLAAHTSIAFLLLALIVVGFGVFAWSTGRHRATVRLDARALVITLAGDVRRFDLDANLDFGEFALPPVSGYPWGGTGVTLRRGPVGAA